jgi:opacity protein-like surface antigen
VASRSIMVRNQLLTSVFAVLAAAAGSALAAEPASSAAETPGFYGGIAVRDAGQQSEGVTLGHLTSVWNRFAPPLAEDSGSRALAFGGYRWSNDVAVEAAVSTLDRYSLQPTLPNARRGVGLALSPDADATGKTWNVDVYTTWEFRKRMSLYGRLGYAQTEPQNSYAPGFVSDVVRRNRDGVNYGLGLRYDMTPALGLRLEYARFGRLPGELSSGVMPENDQVQLGLQFRF